VKIEKQIMAYCPYCNKHTLHIVHMPTKNPQRSKSIGTRRHERAIRGYVGSVEPKLKPKKQGKRQKVILECTVCHKSIERVFFGRTKKKIEIKR